jgi:hypothetical protein
MHSEALPGDKTVSREGQRQSLLVLVPVRLNALAILVLRHLLAAFLLYRSHELLLLGMIL